MTHQATPNITTGAGFYQQMRMLDGNIEAPERHSGIGRRALIKFGAVATGVCAVLAVGHFNGSEQPAMSPNAALAAVANEQGYDYDTTLHQANVDTSLISHSSAAADVPNIDSAMNCVPSNKNMIFYSNQTADGKLGPAITGETVDDVLAEVYDRACHDPLTFTDKAESVGLYKLDQTTRVEKVKEYMNNDTKWNEDFQRFVNRVEKESQSITIKVISGTYITEYSPDDVNGNSIDSNGDGIPDLIKGLEKAGVDMRVLEIKFKDGKTVVWKLECGAQDVDLKEAEEKKVDKTTTTTPATTTTVPGSTTTTTAPEGTTTTSTTVPGSTTTTTRPGSTTTTSTTRPTSTTSTSTTTTTRPTSTTSSTSTTSTSTTSTTAPTTTTSTTTPASTTSTTLRPDDSIVPGPGTPDTTQPPVSGPATPDNGEPSPVGGPNSTTTTTTRPPVQPGTTTTSTTVVAPGNGTPTHPADGVFGN